VDINKVLKDLRAEREMIEEAIFFLERIARLHGERRGRPPQATAPKRARGDPPVPGTSGRPKNKMRVFRRVKGNLSGDGLLEYIQTNGLL
jgi:hypothetical protein